MTTYASPPRHREWKLGCKVYIGNLAEGASKADIEEAFSKYGPLRNVWIARNPPGFAFVEFEDGRDAEGACRHLDGTRIAGARIKAEMSHGRSRRGRGGSGGGPPGRGSHSQMRAPYPPMRSPYPSVRPRGYYNGGDYPPPPPPPTLPYPTDQRRRVGGPRSNSIRSSHESNYRDNHPYRLQEINSPVERLPADKHHYNMDLADFART